jgi:hypothetical protein
MAGQKFNEKMAHLKEFCRVKGLDWGTRAKLVAVSLPVSFLRFG